MNRSALLLLAIVCATAVSVCGCQSRSPDGVHDATLGHDPVRILVLPPEAAGTVPPVGFNSMHEYYAWVEATGRTKPTTSAER